MSNENRLQNETMRHLPTVEFMITKLSEQVRPRLLTMYDAAIVDSRSGDHALRHEAEDGFQAIVRALDRITESITHRHETHGEHDPREQLEHAIDAAITALRSLDPERFRRRVPYDTFERGEGEPLFSHFASLFDRLERQISIIERIDPDIRMKLYDPRWNEPLPREGRALRESVGGDAG